MNAQKHVPLILWTAAMTEFVVSQSSVLGLSAVPHFCFVFQFILVAIGASLFFQVESWNSNSCDVGRKEKFLTRERKLWKIPFVCCPHFIFKHFYFYELRKTLTFVPKEHSSLGYGQLLICSLEKSF